MKLSHLKEGQIEEFNISLVAGDDALPAELEAGVEIQIGRGPSRNSALLRYGDDSWIVEGSDGEADRTLARITSANLPRLAWVQHRIDDEALKIQVHSFPFELVGFELNLGVDEAARKKIEKRNPGCRSLKNCIDWLTEQCLIDSPEGTRVRAFISGPRNDDDLDAFVLHGRAVRVFVKKVYDEDRTEEIWSISKVTNTDSSRAATVALCRGDIEFVDDSEASRAQARVQSQLEELRGERGTSFLELWETYGKLEFAETLSKARRIGVLAYESWSDTADGKVRFNLKEPKKFKGKTPRIDSLAVSDTIPQLITNPASSDTETSPDTNSKENWTPKSAFSADFDNNASNLDRSVVVLDPGDTAAMPPQEGYLFLSLRGDDTNRERREKAREKLNTATSPIPHLALLLEEGRVPTARPRDVKAITDKVRTKVFAGQEPNRSQKQAICTALNTPDIALIQGPPGTGKTTVVRAIVARLDEMLADGHGDSRKVLLSGFQHEAVKNVVEGLEVHGVPAVKFGGPYGTNGYREAMGNLENRRSEIIAQLREKVSDDAPVLLNRRIDEMRVNYIRAPRPTSETATLIERVIELADEHISTSLREELRREIANQRRNSRADGVDPARRRLIARVRSLRSTPEAFADDGPRNAGRLLLAITRGDVASQLGITLTNSEESLLERIAYTDGDRRQADLVSLSALRRRLLEELIITDDQRHRRASVQEAVIELLTKVSDELVRRQRGRSDSLDSVVAEFYDILDREPFEYRQAIYEMTPVWGATCQQAASHSLAKVRREKALEYDTVIIDEAARANPLDLFIPMTQAKRRIILVGDHRQLPHIVDRQLERKLEAELETSDRDDAVQDWFLDKLEESLFEHLRDVLDQRTDRDGFRYMVSLDRQYRTHPILGDFISKNFYENTEDGVELESPRPPEDFTHQLPDLENKVAAWLDVPHRMGRETQAGTSKARRVEAKKLVSHLKRLIDHPAAENLSFGVITYYSGQRQVLWEEMCEQSLAVEKDDGTYAIAPDYQHLETDGGIEERLRMGSVDAFQGREFDVVLLSVVRSNKLPDKTVKQKRRKYGHLMKPNRMNVSMSRQKRLLIVVGDSSILEAPNASGAIGPLINFYNELCGGPDGIVIDAE